MIPTNNSLHWAKRNRKKVTEVYLDYVEDLDTIVANFRQVYNLEPLQVLRLKFKLFITYLANLPATSTLSQIMQIRGLPDSEIEDDKILKLKQKIRLKKQTPQPSQEALGLFVESIISKGGK
ncbi:Gp15 family bacteriophage protein [[Mycoplasma] gypis]|uniref:Gp15 family bacteriophage protein n=1 Tax=[Mycoplasma] gypis TaxID=92404 RepID=A0ABZ2RNK1_9BACT|nr:Gp15 family bacteriophage protein [[Mycoplasma] gypis]MBN0919434.1 hypothetical protein [[Mycoplasma] gypis]